jgi:hypothetical protein
MRTPTWRSVFRRLFKRSSDRSRRDESGRYLPSEEFFEKRAQTFGPDGYDHVDVNRDFKKPQ